MDNSGAVTFWSVDAFITLVRAHSYKKLTPELISRLSAFVDSYILFDTVRLPERYSAATPELEFLGGSDIFRFTPRAELLHSDDLNQGITIDINLALTAFNEIVGEDKYWSLQHDPDLFGAIYGENSELMEGKVISQMRLWLWCAMNEITEKYGSTILLPNSLVGIEKYEKDRSRTTDYVHRRFMEFAKHYQDRLVSASRTIEDPYVDTIKNYPPLLACLLDRANNKEQFLDVLKSMRKEYAALRDLRGKFTSSISSANSVGEKRDIIESWDSSWEQLLKADFKRTGFLSRKISTGDIVKIIFSPDNYLDIIKFLTQQGLDFGEEAKRTKQFKVFCKVASDTDSVYFDNNALYKKFGIEGVVHT
jgi:hypothetical protein